MGFLLTGSMLSQEMIGRSFPDMMLLQEPMHAPDNDCSQSNPSNGFEWFGSNSDDLQLVATDIDVNSGEVFYLEQIITNFVAVDGISNVDVFIWDDNNGFPGNVIGFELITPSSQPIIGTNPLNGWNVYETTLDVAIPFALQGGDNGTKYWVQLYAFAADPIIDAVGWESSSASDVGLKLAFTDSGGTWMYSSMDAVYIFNGDCQTLDVEDNTQTSINIYPSPANERVRLTAGFEIKSKDLKLYDLHGKEVLAPFNNNQLDVSALASGMYLLHIEMDGSSITRKIVVN